MRIFPYSLLWCLAGAQIGISIIHKDDWYQFTDPGRMEGMMGVLLDSKSGAWIRVNATAGAFSNCAASRPKIVVVISRSALYVDRMKVHLCWRVFKAFRAIRTKLLCHRDGEGGRVECS